MMLWLLPITKLSTLIACVGFLSVAVEPLLPLLGAAPAENCAFVRSQVAAYELCTRARDELHKNP